MKKYIEVSIHFDKYIAHPYWPEREMVIKIQKDSGMSRQKSDDKREAALSNQLKKLGLNMDDYRALQKAAERQWYRVDSGDDNSEIIVPRHHLAGCLVQTVGTATKNLRGKFTKDSFRSLVEISDFRTGKFKSDGKFDRYVKLEASNMRSHQVNDYIEDFVATGTFRVSDSVNVDDLRRILESGVETVGVGASRKMGYGRGEVVSFDLAVLV